MAKRKHLKRRRSTAKSAPVIALIVRRGASGRFRKLKEKTETLPVKVQWDRREHERRTAAGTVDQNRRKADRRRTPPFTWDVGDFVVVERTDQRSRRPHQKKRSRSVTDS